MIRTLQHKFVKTAMTAITLLLLCSLPLWKKDAAEEDAPKQHSLSLLQMVRRPAIRTVWVVMLATNAIEYVCGTWGSTYLVHVHGFSAEKGALALTLYYAGLALGRLLSGLLSSKIRTWKRIGIGCCIVCAAMILLLLPLKGSASVIALCLIGLGNGSVYPNLIHLTPHNFGREVSQAVMGSQIAFAYTGVMLAPPLTGAVTRLFGFRSYPLLLAVLFVIMLASLAVFIRHLKRSKRYNPNI